MRRLTTTAIALSLLIVLLGTAHASVITYSGVLDFSYATTGTLNLQQFDGGLGTLTAVTFYVSHSGGAFFNVDNDDTYSVDAYAQMQRAWTITDTGLSASTSHTTTTPSVTLALDNGDGSAIADYTAPDGYSWPSVGFSDPADPYSINNSFFGSYTGLGTLPFAANVTTFSNSIGYIGAPPNQVTTQMGNVNPGLRLNVTVAYEYTEGPTVPEPSTMALLGIGLFGVGAWRRRKSAKA